MTKPINIESYDILYNKENDVFIFSFEINDTHILPENFPKKPVSFIFDTEKRTFDVLFQDNINENVLLSFDALAADSIDANAYRNFESFINNKDKKVYILGLHPSVPVERHHVYFGETVNVTSPTLKKSYII